MLWKPYKLSNLGKIARCHDPQLNLSPVEIVPIASIVHRPLLIGADGNELINPPSATIHEWKFVVSEKRSADLSSPSPPVAHLLPSSPA